MSSDVKQLLPQWIYIISFYSSITSTIIILLSIYFHLLNYRKPFQQRLMIRIQLIVPLFAISCYSMLINQTSPINKFLLEPIREVYEAFVIYTFFSLLTDMLGGERQIIIVTSGREPISHPGILRYLLPKLDISDPHTFLNIKRGILQYVWLKPILCITIIILELIGLYNVNDLSIKSIYFWLTLIYNASVTLSLYCLAIFWKILWNDLKPFKPVGKFLCVKLIIFASYWQGVILAILSVLKLLPNGDIAENDGENIGIAIQNALLCIELIGFAIGHWISFSYYPFTISQLPYGRFQFKYAIKDCLGFKDLISDFGLTFHGDYYKDYKQFDSVEAMVAHPESKGRMSRIHQGLRYHYDGKHKHWLPENQSLLSATTLLSQQGQGQGQGQGQLSISSNSMSVPSTSEIHALDTSSILSNNTSMKGLYPISSRRSSSLEDNYSPLLDLQQQQQQQASSEQQYIQQPISIQDIMENDLELSSSSSSSSNNHGDSIDYTNEEFDIDEILYDESIKQINIYRLDDEKIKKIINYPIVDEVIDSHLYGYKVQKLRQRQKIRDLKSKQQQQHQQHQQNRDASGGSSVSPILQSNESYRYGSIV
ncbi:hypothetical protein MEW_02935 [Candida albicans P60002]|nr:hypothetical protein MEW_02935 [Candida albicans P60002]